jgi:hypothetical protein
VVELVAQGGYVAAPGGAEGADDVVEADRVTDRGTLAPACSRRTAQRWYDLTD